MRLEMISIRLTFRSNDPMACVSAGSNELADTLLLRLKKGSIVDNRGRIDYPNRLSQKRRETGRFLLWNRDDFENFLNDVVCRHFICFGFIAQHNTMAQRVGGQVFDVLRGNVTSVR